MTFYDKATALPVAMPLENTLTVGGNHTINIVINQPLPLPSATRYYLRRYREDLLTAAQSGNRTATSMLECCDYLLIESDRLEGESYE